MLAIKFLLLVLCVFVGYFLGYFLTETEYRLSRFKVFQFEAFECRQCLSFHITWTLTTLISLLFGDWIMFIVGIFFAFMLYVGLRIDQKRRTISIDDYEKIFDA